MRTSSSEFDPHPISNNSLIVSASNGLRLLCVSNSSKSGVGMITLSNGDNNGIWRVNNPENRPGFLRLQNKNTMNKLVTPSDQGIYTCIIPDDNENNFTFNVGLYPNSFNSKS